MSRKILAFGISISAVVLLVLGSQTNVIGYQIVKQSTEHEVANNSLTERISVALIGNKNTQRSVTLSRQQALFLQNELEFLQARINNATSEVQVLQIYKEVASTLGEMHLLPEGFGIRDVVQFLINTEFSLVIQHPFTRLRQETGIINCCCLFAMKAGETVEFNFWTFLGFIIGLFAYKYNLTFLKNLCEHINNYAETKPLRFMNQITVGIGCAFWYFTLGLKGTQTGGEDFDNALGFSGIKIIITQPGYYTYSYYFGTAFLVTSAYYL